MFTKITAVFIGAFVTVSSAFAALPLVITTAATTVQTNMQDMFDLFLPVIVLGVVLGVLVGLLRKYGKTAGRG